VLSMVRMNFLARFLLCLCLVTISSASDTWVVRFDGAGLVKIGMSVSELNATLNENYSMPAAKDQQGCFYLEVGKQPQVALMMIGGRLARIDVRGPGVSTSKGIQVGDSEAHAQTLYGDRLKVEPHKYIDGGHYLTVRSNDETFGVRFETDQGKITVFYAGRYDAIQLVEGCS
jgi:hypothetical protein